MRRLAVDPALSESRRVEQGCRHGRSDAYGGKVQIKARSCVSTDIEVEPFSGFEGASGMSIDLGHKLNDVGVNASDCTTTDADTGERNLSLCAQLDTKSKSGLEGGIASANSNREGLRSDAVTKKGELMKKTVSVYSDLQEAVSDVASKDVRFKEGIVLEGDIKATIEIKNG